MAAAASSKTCLERAEPGWAFHEIQSRRSGSNALNAASPFKVETTERAFFPRSRSRRQAHNAPWISSPISFHSLLLVILFFGATNGSKTDGPLFDFFSKNHGLDCEKAPSMCRAHSHNDYHQADPLSSALKHGLKSVEVDVFPRKGGLWVAHTIMGLDPKRTIDNLYIQPLLDIFQRKLPLQENVQQVSAPIRSQAGFTFQRRRGPFASRSLNALARGGSDLPSSSNVESTAVGTKVRNLSLLVDFKGDADKSASLLQAALSPLKPFLSKVDRNGVFRQGRITVLISGNRPCVTSLQASNGERFLFLDGRAKDVRANSDTHLVPLVSVPWRQVRFAKTMGRGERYMKRLSSEAHAQGKLVRIWGAPNQEKSWRQMVRGNIDLLSVDDHAKFARFVASRH